MGITLQHLFASVILMAVCATARMELSLDRYSKQATTQNVIVSFKGQIESVIDKINNLNFKTIVEKRTALTNAQIAFSNNNQEDVQKYLKTKVVDHETVWINNKMVVYKADDALIKEIKKLKNVVSVDKDKANILDFNVGGRGNRSITSVVPEIAPWGIRKIRADVAWNHYKGNGVVVAAIDSGVLHTHEALQANWRRDYGWFDAIAGSTTPNDQTGHGTHTMGILAGSKGIGVAPEATWIACKACSLSSDIPPKPTCYDGALLLCMQWIQCPTPPNGVLAEKNCGMAPRIVSNSWGNEFGGNNYYDVILKSWLGAGILPVFAVGNYGANGCASVKSPGDRPDAIGVGNTDIHDRIWRTSGLGPSPDTGTSFKPDISAPGTDVLSASHMGNNLYVLDTGTSMACPFVSGVAALMVQKNYALTNYEISRALMVGAVTRELNTRSAPNCGGVAPTTFPNYVFGYGRLDAVNALNGVERIL